MASRDVSARRESLNRENFIRVCTMEELKAKGTMVVSGRRSPILVVHDDGIVHALDNRCPHMGFPLHRGTVKDGILTCHWHHARFDLASGGTFDLWADDVPTCPVDVRNGEVWVADEPRDPADRDAHSWRRLNEGMAHDIGLVIAKSILRLLDAGVEYRELVRDAALFGVRYRDGWGSGLTTLIALANVIPTLPPEETYLALFKGIRRVATDSAGKAARRDRRPLDNKSASLDTLNRWLRHWTRVRHRDGAERTLLTAIANGATPAGLADLLLTAATDRYFAGGGHALDFINKAFECLDLVGWDHADVILPSVVEQMIAAKGGEELNAWRHPVDLVPLLERGFADLPALTAAGRRHSRAWRRHAALAREILGDDPAAIVEALKTAVREGARPTDLSRALAYAAALRIARFGTANEFSDWDTAHHTFTYCNALHQGLKRVAGNGRESHGAYSEAVRGAFHGAMKVYLDRFLNVPPARLPGERGESLDDLPSESDALRALALDLLDRQQQVKGLARVVARYLSLGYSAEPLITTLAHGLLREDAGFHSFQIFEAGLQQFREWGDGVEGRHILIAVARYLAAHSPTKRAQFQTAEVARRLHLGGEVHEADEAAEPAP